MSARFGTSCSEPRRRHLASPWAPPPRQSRHAAAPPVGAAASHFTAVSSLAPSSTKCTAFLALRQSQDRLKRRARRCMVTGSSASTLRPRLQCRARTRLALGRSHNAGATPSFPVGCPHRKQRRSHPAPPLSSFPSHCCPTLRSSGPPTAWPGCAVSGIFRSAGPNRRGPLTSNVMRLLRRANQSWRCFARRLAF